MSGFGRIRDQWRHLEAFTPPGLDAFVFVHAQGGQLRRSNFSKPWARAVGNAGLPSGVDVHDLRHTGNTLTAEAGASLAELMTRMGHSSTRAAKVYLYAREERDRQLADVLDRMARRELKRSGTARNVSRSARNSCMPSPTGSTGNGHSPKPDAEHATPSATRLRQPGGPRDGPVTSARRCAAHDR